MSASKSSDQLVYAYDPNLNICYLRYKCICAQTTLPLVVLLHALSKVQLCMDILQRRNQVGQCRGP